jgi:hypothetical protein
MVWANFKARWQRRPASPPQQHRATVTLTPPPGRRMAGEYLALHTYLDGRFADSVVLSFREIESLLGFALPPAATTDAEWWTGTTSARSAHQDAWRLAHRTAAPNLAMRVVTFDRHS